MSDDERRKRGEAMFREVYEGVVPFPEPEDRDDFFHLTIDQLFSEVWTRKAMSVRDRRLVAIGAIAALGEAEVFEIQVRTAIKHGELTGEQIKDLLIFLAPYVGYPRVTRLRAVALRALKELEA